MLGVELLHPVEDKRCLLQQILLLLCLFLGSLESLVSLETDSLIANHCKVVYLFVENINRFHSSFKVNLVCFKFNQLINAFLVGLLI